ncbi:MAG: ureidoglycolate lyase [Pseudomonadota bacterium]
MTTTMTAGVLHKIPLRPLTPDAFAPYGQVVATRRVFGQGVGVHKDPRTDPEEAQLVLTDGQPRIWIMHTGKVGVRFSKIARHRRTTQCLGSIDGTDWLVGVAPPSDLSDSGRPALDDIVGFRVPAGAIIKLHCATWHAGPHHLLDEARFINLELMDTNQADFHAAELGVECQFDL